MLTLSILLQEREDTRTQPTLITPLMIEATTTDKNTAIFVPERVMIQ